MARLVRHLQQFCKSNFQLFVKCSAFPLQRIYLYLLTANIAASLVSAIRSAPTNPGVVRAKMEKLKSLLNFSD